MAAAPSTDYLQLALASDRGVFTAACPFLFLVGEGQALRSGQHHTMILGDAEGGSPTDWGDAATTVENENAPRRTTGRPPVIPQRPILHAVRKIQPEFASMIMVGRVSNNDVVLPDSSVSKFHAYFRILEGRIELYDAGSKNGTWIGDQKLDPKGAPGVVVPGDTVRFADLRLLLMTAGECWDLVRTSKQ